MKKPNKKKPPDDWKTTLEAIAGGLILVAWCYIIASMPGY